MTGLGLASFHTRSLWCPSQLAELHWCFVVMFLIVDLCGSLYFSSILVLFFLLLRLVPREVALRTGKQELRTCATKSSLPTYTAPIDSHPSVTRQPLSWGSSQPHIGSET